MLDSEGLTRTAGKAVKSGRLRVGGIIRTTATGGPGSVSKASIPSRYETILNTAPRERNAFGNRTLRFDDMDNERPGPGSYRIARTLKSKNPSVSKKGNGFFCVVDQNTARRVASDFVATRAWSVRYLTHASVSKGPPCPSLLH
eukprot:PhF_6_TR442/c0_g1_i1/m.167